MHLPYLLSLKVTELVFLLNWSDSRAHTQPLSIGPFQGTHFIYFCLSGLSKIPDTLEELNEAMNKYFWFKPGFSFSLSCGYCSPIWPSHTGSEWKGSDNWVPPLHYFLKENKSKNDSLKKKTRFFSIPTAYCPWPSNQWQHLISFLCCDLFFCQVPESSVPNTMQKGLIRSFQELLIFYLMKNSSVSVYWSL